MIKKNWNEFEIQELFDQPLMDLIHQAQHIHRQNFPANSIEVCALLSIKTGSCPEDCAYCPQSAHYQTNIDNHALLDVETIIAAAKNAQSLGASRYCMGAAWRSPPVREFTKIITIIKAVKNLGLNTCMTLGMLTKQQAQDLKTAGLDYYNHNLDTSPEYYKKIISTRTYDDRIQTLNHVHEAGLKTCCGGIIGMGETRQDRIQFLKALTELKKPPHSIPINQLIPIKGTPLSNIEKLDSYEMVRVIAITRILIPSSIIRISAGRENMNDDLHLLCFLAGANSIFYGEKLLTMNNSNIAKDKELIARLKLNPETLS